MLYKYTIWWRWWQWWGDDDDMHIMTCLFVTKNDHFLRRSVCLFVCNVVTFSRESGGTRHETPKIITSSRGSVGAPPCGSKKHHFLKKVNNIQSELDETLRTPKNVPAWPAWTVSRPHDPACWGGFGLVSKNISFGWHREYIVKLQNT